MPGPRLISAAVLLVSMLSAADGLRAAERPPRDLKRVGDHWTAWDPPAEFPAGAQIYTIVQGDTLWDLAARFYNNPYLWPQLWELNRYILDAHWIYPGDPLVVTIEVTPVETITEAVPPPAGETPGPTEPPRGTQRADAAAGRPVPLGAESDIYCGGYISDPEESFGYAIIGSEYENLSPTLGNRPGQLRGIYGSVDAVKVGLATGDIVYLDGGRGAGLSPGSVFTVVAPGQLVAHPVTGRLVGRLYRYQGRVRVLSVQEVTAIAEIILACDPIIVGAYLKPYEPEPVPLGRRTAMRPVNLPASEAQLAAAAVILTSDENLVSLGEDHVVYIDRGSQDDVLPGDIFTVYRLNRPGLPPVVVGELAVLSVHSSTALARIVTSRHAIYVGDRLVPK